MWYEIGNSKFWDTSMLSDPSFYVGTLILCVMGYIIGSINAAQILSKIGSKNVGDVGSKNFGATNAGRIYGKKGFIFVFAFDMIKAIIAGLIFTLIVNKAHTDKNSIFFAASIPLAMLSIVIGHSWPIFFKFKGGKGVATSFGIIVVFNWLFAIISIITFIVILIYIRRTGIASIISTSVGGFLVIFIQFYFPSELIFDWTMTWMSIFVAILLVSLVIFRHRKNLIEVIKGDVPLIKPKKIKNENKKNN